MTSIQPKQEHLLRIAAFGDITGAIGRATIQEMIPHVKSEWDLDLVIVNAENASHGFGLTPKHAQEIKSYGIDLITMGNHTWDKHLLRYRINDFEYIARPLNYPREAPGSGVAITETKFGKFAVINLVGRLFMNPSDCPFHAVYDKIKELKASGIKMIAVDFHAEATSEKLIMGRFLDGIATIVWGTHTHVPTADNMILPKGTGYISDLGMTGAQHSILGFEIAPALKKMIYNEPSRHKPETKGTRITSGIIADIDPETGKTIWIERFSKYLPEMLDIIEEPNKNTSEEDES